MKKPTRLLDEEYNPCVKEHHLVNKCLDREDYNHDKCELFFENYRQCKYFWAKIRRDRIMKNIQPYMPGKAEREKIMEERNKSKANK